MLKGHESSEPTFRNFQGRTVSFQGGSMFLCHGGCVPFWWSHVSDLCNWRIPGSERATCCDPSHNKYHNFFGESIYVFCPLPFLPIVQVDRDDDKADLGDSNYDEFSGYSGPVATVTGPVTVLLKTRTEGFARWSKNKNNLHVFLFCPCLLVTSVLGNH